VALNGVKSRLFCQQFEYQEATIINFNFVKEDALKNTLEKIGAKLTDLRKQKGYTSHEDFAYDFDIPRVQYWRIEKGKTNVTIKSLCRLLSIHKMSLEEFFCILQKEPVKK
jgi:DNA-binding XRE family transcriptional regulator